MGIIKHTQDVAKAGTSIDDALYVETYAIEMTDYDGNQHLDLDERKHTIASPWLYR